MIEAVGRALRRPRAPGAPAVRRRRDRQARRPVPVPRAGRRQGVRRRAAGRRRRPALGLVRRAGPSRGCSSCARSSTRYANLRPVRHGDIDLMVVRELTGGLYFGAQGARGRQRLRHLQLHARADRAGRALGASGSPSAAPAGLSRWTRQTCSPRPSCGARWSTELHERSSRSCALDARAGRLVRDEPGDPAGGLRRDPDREPVRRHPLRPRRGRRRRPGPGALGVDRHRAAGHLRAGARLGARHRRPGRGEPDRDDPARSA